MEEPREGPAPCSQLPQGDSRLCMSWHKTGMLTAGEKGEDSGVHAGTSLGAATEDMGEDVGSAPLCFVQK